MLTASAFISFFISRCAGNMDVHMFLVLGACTGLAPTSSRTNGKKPEIHRSRWGPCFWLSEGYQPTPPIRLVWMESCAPKLLWIIALWWHSKFNLVIKATFYKPSDLRKIRCWQTYFVQIPTLALSTNLMAKLNQVGMLTNQYSWVSFCTLRCKGSIQQLPSANKEQFFDVFIPQKIL